MKQTPPQLVSLVAAVLTAAGAVIARFNPDHWLSNQGMQDDLMTLFAAASALFVGLWTIFQSQQLGPKPPQTPPPAAQEPPKAAKE